MRQVTIWSHIVNPHKCTRRLVVNYLKQCNASAAPMFGFTIILMHLADYLHGRRNRTCSVCKRRFETYEDLDKHLQESHQDA